MAGLASRGLACAAARTIWAVRRPIGPLQREGERTCAPVQQTVISRQPSRVRTADGTLVIDTQPRGDNLRFNLRTRAFAP